MNTLNFGGRVVHKDTIRGDNTSVLRFAVLRQEYAGKDAAGQAKYREVRLPFTAFGHQAEFIDKHVYVGDQVFIQGAIENNNYEVDGQRRYEFSFKVEQIEQGAPGKAKREALAARGANPDEGDGQDEEIPGF